LIANGSFNVPALALQQLFSQDDARYASFLLNGKCANTQEAYQATVERQDKI
jgi:hypothetical protein